MAATAVSLRCFNFLKHMFCCKRARTTQCTHGDEVHLPALWCYTGFKASAVFVFSVSVCQWMMIQPHTSCFLFSFAYNFSSPYPFAHPYFVCCNINIVTNVKKTNPIKLKSNHSRKLWIYVLLRDFISKSISTIKHETVSQDYWSDSASFFPNGWFWMCLLAQDGKCEC